MAGALEPTPEQPLHRVGLELARGSLVNLGFAVANSALALLATIFAGNALGPAGIGVLTLGFLVLEFAGMLDNLGTAGFLRDYAAEPHPGKLATVLRLKLLLGAGTAILLALAAMPLALALDIPATLLLLFALIPVTSIVSSVAQMLHEARRHPWRRNSPGTVEAVAKAALYGAFWLLLDAGGDVILFAWGAVLASVVGAAAGSLLVPSYRLRGWEPARSRSYLSFGLVNQATGVLKKTLFWVDILLIDILLASHYQQGLYRVAYSVMAFVPFFAGTVGIFLYPAIAEASQRGDTERVRELLRRSLQYVLLIAAPLALGALAFAVPVLRLFGPAFLEATWMLQALALVSLLPSLLVPFEALFPAIDRPRVSLRITGAMAAVNVALDLVLIPPWGPAGAIVGTTCALLLGLALSVAAARRLGFVGGVTPLARARRAASADFAGRQPP